MYSLELVSCSLSGREVVLGLCMNEALLGGRVAVRSNMVAPEF